MSSAGLDQIVLAHEPPFRLGDVEVVPATRQIARGDVTETIEPRVMQVLIVLARRRGSVIPREQLIRECWNDRVVTDDAVNRVISRIRHLAAAIGAGSFRLDTIPRVGYRLTERAIESLPPAAPTIDAAAIASAAAQTMATPASATDAPAHPTATDAALVPPAAGAGRVTHALSRRAVLFGVASLVVAGTATAIGWQRRRQREPALEARRLHERAALLSREALPGQIRQSVSYLERAVRLDPTYGAGWGALALGYSHLIGEVSDAEQTSLPDRIRNAAARAFELDGGNADAELALISVVPRFRNWTDTEARLRALVRDHPQHWLAHGRLAMLLYQVGRLSEGVEQHRAALAIEPMLPIAYASLIRNLSALGRVQEADATVEKAAQLWPTHPMLWIVTFEHYLYSGRPRAASGFASNSATLPSGFGPPQVDRRLRLAKALETGTTADVDAALAEHVSIALADTDAIPMAVPVFAALGQDDLVFDSLDRYLLDRGPFESRVRRPDVVDRSTDMLFALPLSRHRQTPRFESLVTAIGMDAYWRSAGAVPDYRRRLG
jgi:DNA-binding winged helix-turn-helix (wHTH) protein/Tfp pilus assembly protein PilF